MEEKPSVDFTETNNHLIPFENTNPIRYVITRESLEEENGRATPSCLSHSQSQEIGHTSPEDKEKIIGSIVINQKRIVAAHSEQQVNTKNVGTQYEQKSSSSFDGSKKQFINENLPNRTPTSFECFEEFPCKPTTSDKSEQTIEEVRRSRVSIGMQVLIEKKLTMDCWSQTDDSNQSGVETPTMNTVVAKINEVQKEISALRNSFLGQFLVFMNRISIQSQENKNIGRLEKADNLGIYSRATHKKWVPDKNLQNEVENNNKEVDETSKSTNIITKRADAGDENQQNYVETNKFIKEQKPKIGQKRKLSLEKTKVDKDSSYKNGNVPAKKSKKQTRNCNDLKENAESYVLSKLRKRHNREQ